MVYRILIAVAFTVYVFLQTSCVEKNNDAEPSVKDTVVTGIVSVYDSYGIEIQPAPVVKVIAFQMDSLFNVVSEYESFTDNEGSYVLNTLAPGTYSIRYQSDGFGDYVLNNVAFDSLGPVLLDEVKLTTYASGEVQLKGISSAQIEHGIIEFDREIVFGPGAPSEFSLKTRYMFGYESNITSENCIYSYVSGTSDGASGASDRQTVKFAMVNLQTIIPDSTDLFVTVALETPQSQEYQLGEKIYYPNIKFPLPEGKPYRYELPVVDENDENFSDGY